MIRPGFQSDDEKKLLFYIFPIPENVNEIRYRLVIDGLWSSDPVNPYTVFDYTHGMSVSAVTVPFYKEYKTAIEGKNTVRFTYLGEAKQRIKLAGSFNNWDPFMYFMEETSEGIYELTLPLPKGTHTYSYFLGTEMKVDITNHERVYSSDGKVVSLLTL